MKMSKQGGEQGTLLKIGTKESTSRALPKARKTLIERQKMGNSAESVNVTQSLSNGQSRGAVRQDVTDALLGWARRMADRYHGGKGPFAESGK